MRYQVLYAKSLRDVPYGTTPESVSADAYNQVGYVDATDLEDLFRIMNAVDGTEHCCVIDVRSMSVGDIAIDESGQAHFCASMGWKQTVVASASLLASS